jgi:hypothetical protein
MRTLETTLGQTFLKKNGLLKKVAISQEISIYLKDFISYLITNVNYIIKVLGL